MAPVIEQAEHKFNIRRAGCESFNDERKIVDLRLYPR
jgi:hypothetical protein